MTHLRLVEPAGEKGGEARDQTDLFGGSLPETKPVALEVHEHVFIRGPRAVEGKSHFRHSHEGGDVPHQHPDTGPASYNIDKDEWARATGAEGGGRKEFTEKPEGEQFPIVELEDWQKSFKVIVHPPPKNFKGTGAGVLPIVRMMLAHKLTPHIEEGGTPPPQRKGRAT